MVWNGANDPQEYITAEEQEGPTDYELDLREALAQIVGAFTSGVYCSSCGESVDDCDCVISTARTLLGQS